jgi:hypothetical protein
MLKKLLFILPIIIIFYFAYRYISENPIKPQKIDENCPYYKDLLGRAVAFDQEIEKYAQDLESPWILYSGVDLNNFKVLKSTDGCLATDDKFFFNGIRKMENVDIGTWEEIGNNFSKDSKNVYHFSKKLEGVDPNTFEILSIPECGQKFYTKDIQNVYYDFKILESADAPTFYVTCEHGLLLGTNPLNYLK